VQQASALCIHVDEALQLRLHEARYAELYFALIERNRTHLQAWEPWASDEGSLESTRTYIKQTLHQFAEGTSLQTEIWYQDQLVGSIGLHGIDGADRKAEIGYWIDAAMQGKGIVTRACRALISYAFTHYHLHRVEIHCAAENTRSRAIPERLGFTQEGIQRQSQLLNGQFVDIVVYSLLSSEWQA